MNTTFTEPVLAPDIQKKRMQLMHNQALAQRLMQSEMPQGQMVSGHYVAPNITQYLAHGLKQYMGNKALRDLPEQAAKLQRDESNWWAGQFGLGKPTPQDYAAGLSSDSPPRLSGAQASPTDAGGPSPQQLGQALAQDGVQQPLAHQPMPQGQPQAQQPQRPQMPLLPGRSAQESLRAFQYLGPKDYMRLVVQQGAPTDTQRDLIAQGIQPGTPEWNEAMTRVNFKGGYVAPVSAAPGTTLIDPQTNKPTFAAPQNGIQTQYGPNGPQSSVVPGYADANAAVQGAEAKALEKAKAEADLAEVVDENGGKRFVPRAQVLEGGYKSAPSSANAAYDEAQAKQYSTLSDQLTKMGMEAPMTLAKLDRVEQLIGDFDGGKLTGIAMSAAEIGNSLGIKLDPKLGDKQAASALMNEMALKLKNAGGANQMPGAMSDADRQFLLTMSPQLSQSSEGRKTIIETYRALAHREQQVARMADAYRERNNGRLDAGFTRRLSGWSSKYPLFGSNK
ncbi:hypothetical protein V0R37_15155 [Pollutimonas sp. H1-120]|uniref:hypothetical protein n=1 Tax=Pollutimonas sp. H1-120 TaxID=3148824 RepID=UPI003B51FCB9